MANVYDLMLLLDASAPDDRRAKIVSDVESAISSGGSLIGKHDWGRRNLAYEIRHQADAEYHLFQFDGPPTLLESLQRTLKFADGVVRFRIIKLAPGTPEPPSVRPEPPRAESRTPEAPVTEVPVAEASVAEAPVAEAPPAELPASDAPPPEVPAGESENGFSGDAER